MHALLTYLRRYRDSRKHVRPWALAVPILVLLICLPLLRPLRHADPRQISDHEIARLATVQAMVERGTLALDFDTFQPEQNVIEVREEFYADQPPVFSALLASAYWSMHRLDVTFATHPALVTYLLTVLGTTLPAAGIAGLVYRMGRLFELPRIWRTALAAVVVFGGGVLAYATVLNEHVPAAALVMSSAACLVHIALIKRRLSASVWLTLAGFCAALAMTVDLTAAAFAPLLGGVVLALPWSRLTRAGALLLYILGMVPPILLHLALTIPVTGDWRPGNLHPELAAPLALAPYDAFDSDDWDDDLTDNGYGTLVLRSLIRVGDTLFGGNGLLSHFPILILGALGISMVMHRHWPNSTKMLAVASAAAAIGVIVLAAIDQPGDPGYASRWFVVVMPMLTFWIGAWLRRPHRPLSWALAGIVLAFSTLITFIGATGPLPRDGFTGYTAADAFDRLITGQSPEIAPSFVAARP
ncbi:MAG TPA: hypothetical protein VGN72_16480 [Tepidisphaeraceae bacterium]|jgi:hypothetical protein|nr:hypothetical protein [Tepidisphaeraceae bacterium]